MTAVDLAVIKALAPADVFNGDGGAERIVQRIEAEARAVSTDILTSAGRAQVTSLAHRIARSKTHLDEMGKVLVADWKAKAGAVDAERRTIRERLDALKDAVRAPLTAWESADEARVAEHVAALAAIEQAAIFAAPEPTAAAVQTKTEWLSAYGHNRDWQEFTDRATQARERATQALEALLAAAQQREAERAELERLRRETAEQARRERETQIAAAAAEQARQAEATAAAEAARHEKALAQAQAAAAAAEAERVRAETEARAAAELQRVEREKAEAEERARKAEQDRRDAAVRAEQDRLAATAAAERERERAIETERQRVADARAAEDAAAAAREANRKHAAKINGEVRDSLVKTGLTVEQATAVVVAMVRGQVPHVKITY